MGSSGSSARKSRDAAAGPGRDESVLRVILVGRTGLDAKLRLDPGVELVRARTALDAVGELSNPIDPEAQSQSVVIVAPDADPAGPAHSDGERAKEFTGALRSIDGGVRILRLEAGDGSAPSRGGYDGVISPDVSADVLRAAIRGDAAPSDAAVIEAVAAESAVAPAIKADDVEPLIESMLSGQRPAAMSEAGDEALVRTLLQGRDITDLAVELIRKRLGSTDVAFVTSGQIAAPGAAPVEAVNETTVGWKGRLLGRLRSRSVPAELLAAHAAWLAAWLAFRDQHAQLREAAFTDPLTGAHNRRFFDHFLRSAIDHASAKRQSVTVLMFDIDDFKRFNDEFGHGAGDDILRETVRLLRSVIRPTDRVCRIGGDEFVVVFHEPDGPRNPSSKPPSSVYEIAKRFQDAIAAHKFPKLGREAPGRLAVSGGLATFPWDGRTAEELLTRADALALQSKKSGKNCITLGPGAERERTDLPGGPV